LNRTDPQSSSSFIRPGRQGDGDPLGRGGLVGESLGEGDSVGESLGEGDSVGESVGEGDSVGESVGEGDSVGESVGEGDDVSLAGGSGESVAVGVGGGGKAVVVGDGTGGVGWGSVAGGASDPSFPAPVVGSVPTTGAYRAVKACSRASGCNQRVTAATRSEGPADSSGDSGMAPPGMTGTRSHQPIPPFPTNVRTASCGDFINTNRTATPAATIAKNKTFSQRSRSHRSRPHHGRRYGSRIHRIGASPVDLCVICWLSAAQRKAKLGAGPAERRNKVTRSALQSAWSEFGTDHRRVIASPSDSRSARLQEQHPMVPQCSGMYPEAIARSRRALKGTFSLIHHAATASYSWIRPPRTSIRRTSGTSAEIARSEVPVGVRRSRPRWGRWAL
jgi:hypothetical protein